MDSFSLNIAGHNLCFKRDSVAPLLTPSEKLSEFMSDSDGADITITVFNKPLQEIDAEKELFSAPYIEEENDGSFVKKSDRFWSVYEAGNMKMIRIWDTETGNVECNLLLMSDSTEWELYCNSKSICANPFSYPLDGLMLYYMSLKNKNLIIHASSIKCNGRGYLFPGVSGKGKTTMANLWKAAGAAMINDDLLILSQNEDGSIIASSTPLNANTFYRQTQVHALFLIEHSNQNTIIPLKRTEAITSVLSNTIQHNYNKEMINSHIGKVMEIVESIPVYRMGFTPDKRAVEAILGLRVEELNGLRVEKVEGAERVERIDAIETIKAVIESGNSVELNAEGYSMFPTLRPGDRVVIKPMPKGELPVKGSVVVFTDNGTMAQRHNGLMADKNDIVFVMHRVVEIKNDASGDLLFITRGDSGVECDKPWPIEQMVGEAVRFKRGRKENTIKFFVPGEWRYKYNQRLLWMFNKITRILR